MQRLELACAIWWAGRGERHSSYFFNSKKPQSNALIVFAEEYTVHKLLNTVMQKTLLLILETAQQSQPTAIQVQSGDYIHSHNA